jgi:hypothetical protein
MNDDLSHVVLEIPSHYFFLIWSRIGRGVTFHCIKDSSDIESGSCTSRTLTYRWTTLTIEIEV